MPVQIPPVSFNKSMASRDAFGGFKFAAFKPKNISAAPMVMINPPLRDSSMSFFPIKTTHLFYKAFYHIRLSFPYWPRQQPYQ